MRKLYKLVFAGIIIIILLTTPLKSTDITTLIKKGNYDKIKTLFKDNSYNILLERLKNYKVISIKKSGENSFTLNLLKNDRGKIVNFSYRLTKDSKIEALSSVEIINPFFIIKKVKKFALKNKNLKISDAKIYIKKANLYIISSSFFPILIKGKINIIVEPSDNEEKKHFIHLFKKPYKKFKVKWIIISAFDFKDKFNEIIKNESPSFLQENALDKNLLEKFKSIFGFNLEGIKNTGFLLNEKSENLLIFPYKRNKILTFKFDKTAYPDTQLFGLNFKKILLDYNSLKTMKILSGLSLSKISAINLNLLFADNMKDYFAREKIFFKEPTNKLSMNLPKYIKITRVSSKNNKVSYYKALIKIFLKSKFSMKEMEIDFTSHFLENDETDFYFSERKKISERYIFSKKPFYFFGRNSNYYLKDNLDFTEFKLNIGTKTKITCLGGGKKSDNNTFFSKSTKGMPIVCGDFEFIKSIKSGGLNINIYSDFIPNNSLKKEINRLSFIYPKLKHMFGSLDLKKLNIVITHEHNLSGSSYQGLIIIKIPKRKKTFYYPSSPVKFTIDLTDFLIHELAHQWWGGIVSWLSFRDMWLTEGFPQFSILEYMEKEKPKQFEKILKDMSKSVKKYYEYGPIAYGKRIGNWEGKPNAYFSIIYNKSALILYMLKELMGEKEFFLRVKNILKIYKYSSISTATVIYNLTKKKPLLNKFLRDWVFRRELPIIHYKINSHGNKIQIELRQLNSEPFIFPLYIKLFYKNRAEIKKLVVKQKKEFFTINLKENPLSIKIMEDYITPIIIK